MERDSHRRGHPRNRLLVQDSRGRQRFVDTTGLTQVMLAAAQKAMDPGVIDGLRRADRRPQDILIAYARAVRDPEHLHIVWHTIPPEERRVDRVDETTRFFSFFHALRHWRRRSVLDARRQATSAVRTRQAGAGLLFRPPTAGYYITDATRIAGTPASWLVIPGPDTAEFEQRHADTLDAMTHRALKAGGLTPDEIASEWPVSRPGDAIRAAAS